MSFNMNILKIGEKVNSEKITELYTNPPDCPFCGSKAETETDWDWSENSVLIVSCTNKKCPVSKYWFSLKMWCTRPREVELMERINLMESENL